MNLTQAHTENDISDYHFVRKTTGSFWFCVPLLGCFSFMALGECTYIPLNCSYYREAKFQLISPIPSYFHVFTQVHFISSRSGDFISLHITKFSCMLCKLQPTLTCSINIGFSSGFSLLFSFSFWEKKAFQTYADWDKIWNVTSNWTLVKISLVQLTFNIDNYKSSTVSVLKTRDVWTFEKVAA